MKRVAIIISVTALSLLVALYWWRQANAGIYNTFSSPDGRYRIEVWRYQNSMRPLETLAGHLGSSDLSR